MFAIRSKKTKEYLKLICTYQSSHKSDYELNFADHCIELNYYVNDSLGFIRSVLLKESDGSEYEPELEKHINPHELEVINLKTQEIVSIKDILDGWDLDELPPFVSPKNDDDIIIFREAD